MKKLITIIGIFPFTCLAQDTITFTDGKSIKAKVTEITEDEVRYKDWEFLNGYEIFILKSYVRSIKYEDGKVVSFSDSPREYIAKTVDSAGHEGIASDPDVASDSKIYTYVSQMPKPAVNILQYLKENIHYPDTARKKGIRGKVVVKFIVDESGNVTNVKAINTPLGYGLEEEAIRVIKSMPKWIPGKVDGKPVKAWYTQPINFSIN